MSESIVLEMCLNQLQAWYDATRDSQSAEVQQRRSEIAELLRANGRSVR